MEIWLNKVCDESQESRRTLNVVYKEVFNSIRLQIVYVCNNGLEIDFSYDLRDEDISQNSRLLLKESIATFQITLFVMNIEWNYGYYQPWSDNKWLVDEMLAI